MLQRTTLKDYIFFQRFMNAVNFNMEEDENILSDSETIIEFNIRDFQDDNDE